MRCRWVAPLALALLSTACQRVPAPVNFIAEGKPEKLSDWHVVERSGQRLQLNAGVLPYDLNTPLFSDHAHKLRTIGGKRDLISLPAQDQLEQLPHIWFVVRY